MNCDHNASFEIQVGLEMIPETPKNYIKSNILKNDPFKARSTKWPIPSNSFTKCTFSTS